MTQNEEKEAKRSQQDSRKPGGKRRSTTQEADSLSPTPVAQGEDPTSDPITADPATTDSSATDSNPSTTDSEEEKTNQEGTERETEEQDK